MRKDEDKDKGKRKGKGKAKDEKPKKGRIEDQPTKGRQAEQGLVHDEARPENAEATAKTTYGTCGIKVWVFKGEILAHDPMAHEKRMQEAHPGR